MSDLDLGLIGNGTIGALIDRLGRIVWCCLPRFDGDPVFNALVDGTNPARGFFAIDLVDQARAERRYVPNTAVMETTLVDREGGEVLVTDFCPRFRQHDRMFRPTTLVRHIRRIAGRPRIRVHLRPTFDYGSVIPRTTRGSNHIRYIGGSRALRLTTNAPVSFVIEEAPFLLDGELVFFIGDDESLMAPLPETCRAFHDKTVAYWQDWVRSLSVPFDYQEAVIRAAITLKQCAFEESGAIVAAFTTSIPEARDSGRNWDYRYCWLRDAYFVVHALNRLCVTRTMEHFHRYIANIVAQADAAGVHLQPVYGLTLETELEERTVPDLSGYRDMGPVRVGNLAHVQIQNDVYGSLILATTQAFFDERLTMRADGALFEQIEHLGERAAAIYDTPDAGLWEFRTIAAVHTFSAVMCWAGCDRLARIAEHMRRGERARHWRGIADTMHETICRRAWSESRGSFVSTFEGESLDASLLQLQAVGFVRADDARFLGTLAAIEAELRHGDHMMRYRTTDDFGLPESAFTVCTFWYIDALAAVGRVDEARRLFDNLLEGRNELGLLSEDIDPDSGELWGNFPQSYSMVGLVNSAMRLSRTWESML